MLNELLARQSHIKAVIAQGRDLLADDYVHARVELPRWRGDLNHSLTTYQIYKHHGLFRDVRAKGSARAAGLARRLQSSCVQLGYELRIHMVRWTDEDIGQRWASYRAEALTLLDRATGQLLDEEHLAQSFWGGAVAKSRAARWNAQSGEEPIVDIIPMH